MSSSARRYAAVAALFLAIALLVYGAAVIGNGFVDFDDSLLIYDNQAVLNPLTPSSIAWAFTHYDPELYIPLTFLSYQLDSFVGNMSPVFFHLHNLLLHVANALLITWLLFALAGRPFIAVVLGLIYLVHPLNTVTVVWASARKDLLSTLFFLVSLTLYVQYRTGLSAARYQLPATRYPLVYWSSVGAFVLGLLAKVTIAPLPLILLLLDWRETGRVTWADVRGKAAYFAAAVGIGLLGLLGKDVVLKRLPSLGDSILLSFRSTAFYLQKFFWPADLSILYPYNPADVTLTHVPYALSIAVVLLLAWLAWRARQVSRIIPFGAALFLLAIMPSFLHYTRGLEPYLASDRYMYVPMIGLLCIAAAALKRRLPPARTNAMLAAGGVLVVVLGMASAERSLDWRSTLTLFSSVLEHSESALAYEKVGTEYLKQGQYRKAETNLRRSVSIKPNANAYYNLSVLMRETGREEKERTLLQKALATGPFHPEAHINMARILWEEGRRDEAIVHAQKGVEYDPDNMMGLGNLATMYTLTGKEEKARRVIRRIRTLDPDNERVEPLLEKLGQ